MSESLHAVGLLYHPKKPESVTLAEQMESFLRERGNQIWVGSAWDEPVALAHVAGLDLLVTLGGDGTMLRAARVGSSHGVPIVGVKLGKVSFLAEVQPEAWREPLEQMLAGNYWLEERMLLDVCVVRGGQPPVNHSYLALNDVVISRGGLARMVTVETWVDHGFLTTYRADGVIVSTPTGSTGYALAAGGPILPPELKNILLLPICPHLSLDRPVVLAQGATVILHAQADYAPILTVDGQFEIALAEGDQVEVRASSHVSHFVHVQDRAYFYRTLMERLRWRG
jgi:NAD+ kinase